MASFMASSCSDMLTPGLTRYSEDYAKDSVYSAFGILKSIQKVGERTVLLDAARSDLSSIGTYTTDSIRSIANFENPEDGSSTLLNAADYYHIINSCNFYFARVDTALSKNGVPELKREYAQIQSLRAWTYIQLVRYYGSVPFITQPISNTDQADALAKSSTKATKDNLIDLLIEHGLYRAYELQTQYHMPDYGTLNNGEVTFPSKACFIPVQLVLADAYLMKNEYAKAAQYYYDYFYYLSKEDNNTTYASTSTSIVAQSGGISGYTINGYPWLGSIKTYSESEQPAIIVSAANSSFGTVISGIAHTFGFETKTTMSGSTGTVTTTPNEQYQQILPSQNYTSLNKAQNFCIWSQENGSEKIVYAEGAGDARLYASAPNVEFTHNNLSRIIDKFCYASTNVGTSSLANAAAAAFSMLYEIPLYRKSQLYLRYAEAINRMGFPEMAFGVLKDGLFRQNFPTLSYEDQNVYYRNPNDRTDTLGVIVTKTVGGTTVKDTLLYSKGYKADSTLKNVPYFSDSPAAYTHGMYYLSLDEMVRASKYKYLNFWSDAIWDYSATESAARAGIHSRGCGSTGGTQDTIYTYARMVAKKVAENRARLNGLTHTAQVALEETLHRGDTLLVSKMTSDEIINAVEDLIVDENALEMAFEGHRFTDLVRFADHKTQAGLDGKNWLAWKLARRNYDVSADATQYDASLYSKLQDESYWYFTLPKTE